MLVVMVGLPASGKTTYAESNFRAVVSPDRIRLDVSRSVAWKRNRERERPVPRRSFAEIVLAFEPPTEDEGFAAVIRLPDRDPNG